MGPIAVGLGDNLMASGMARGAAARGKRIAFGDGHKIIWDTHSPTIFKGNPNIAAPGSERDRDLEWIAFHRGSRIYNHHDIPGDRWVWNYEFNIVPGEVFFSKDEEKFAAAYGKGFVLIEPNVPAQKSVAANKQWGVERYDAVAASLLASGIDVRQFYYGVGHRCQGVKTIWTPTFRSALSVLKNAALYIGPEGGLHHGAAAVGIPGVVLFGGFIPPEVTGYDTHTNLTGGEKHACGSLKPCPHCRAALDRIEVGEVVDAARGYLSA